MQNISMLFSDKESVITFAMIKDREWFWPWMNYNGPKLLDGKISRVRSLHCLHLLRYSSKSGWGWQELKLNCLTCFLSLKLLFIYLLLTWGSHCNFTIHKIFNILVCYQRAEIGFDNRGFRSCQITRSALHCSLKEIVNTINISTQKMACTANTG